jgi:uncharacterized RDD family membrane protein YckC
VAKIKCQSCGYDNTFEARFCANCGSILTASIETPAPTAIPGTELAPEIAVEYMGFWIRFGAAIIDGIIVSIISSMLSVFQLFNIFGYWHFFLPAFFWFPIPWLYHWLFIGLKGQTLGKMAVGIKVVNTKGSGPGLGTAALREIPGKLLSSIAIYLGFLWIIWDGKKQGWHDKIASTYVVRVESGR